MTKIIGIDYSLTCPAVCVVDERPLVDDPLQNCKFYYLTTVKKYEGVFLDGKVIGDRIEDYTNQQERHDNISNWLFKRAVGNSINPTVFIEDYSFGSKGRVFNLAENTGLLKHKLYKKNMDGKNSFASPKVGLERLVKSEAQALINNVPIHNYEAFHCMVSILYNSRKRMWPYCTSTTVKSIRVI